MYRTSPTFLVVCPQPRLWPHLLPRMPSLAVSQPRDFPLPGVLRFAVAVPPLPGMLFRHLPLWLTPHFLLVSLNCHIIGDALPQLTQRPVETGSLPSHTLHSPPRCLAFRVALTVSQEIPSLLVAFLPPWGQGFGFFFFIFFTAVSLRPGVY